MRCSIPANIAFQQRDIESPWHGMEQDSWDFIHIQMLNGSISDWQGIYNKTYRYRLHENDALPILTLAGISSQNLDGLNMLKSTWNHAVMMELSVRITPFTRGIAHSWIVPKWHIAPWRTITTPTKCCNWQDLLIFKKRPSSCQSIHGIRTQSK